VDEDALAYEAALKRARRLEALEWNEFRTRLGEFLARRGFSYSVVAPVVSRTWDEIHKHDSKEKTDDEETE
jgi:regulatory protein